MFYEYNIEPRLNSYQFTNHEPIVIKRGSLVSIYRFNKIRVAYKNKGWEVVELKCGIISPTTIHDGELVSDVDIGIIY